MDNKIKIAGGVAVGALIVALILPRTAFAKGPDGYANILSANLKSIPLPDFVKEKYDGQTPKQLARDLITYHDRPSGFNGWFSNPDHNAADVLAVWQVESAFDFEAIRLNDGGKGNHAYGVGQVLDTTSGDYGVQNPKAMFQPMYGTDISMRHLKWSWEYLERALGRPPTRREWISSYQQGVGNTVKGKINYSYLAKWYLARYPSVKIPLAGLAVVLAGPSSLLIL